ncbi:unnamed protein product [Acanthosepion pharaonis]|uniref:Uncharacterized protein n=1 Tax=Acanthosepion pharaonis TaxID=158019 RepID=A0A812B3B3_ACAPH|nr:unnamed protein product [Sepia pharaonis]
MSCLKSIPPPFLFFLFLFFHSLSPLFMPFYQTPLILSLVFFIHLLSLSLYIFFLFPTLSDSPFLIPAFLLQIISQSLLCPELSLCQTLSLSLSSFSSSPESLFLYLSPPTSKLSSSHSRSSSSLDSAFLSLSFFLFPVHLSFSFQLISFSFLTHFILCTFLFTPPPLLKKSFSFLFVFIDLSFLSPLPTNQSTLEVFLLIPFLVGPSSAPPTLGTRANSSPQAKKFLMSDTVAEDGKRKCGCCPAYLSIALLLNYSPISETFSYLKLTSSLPNSSKPEPTCAHPQTPRRLPKIGNDITPFPTHIQGLFFLP